MPTIDEIKINLRKKLKKRLNKPKTQMKITPPRYDDIYFHGLEQLERSFKMLKPDEITKIVNITQSDDDNFLILIDTLNEGGRPTARELLLQTKLVELIKEKKQLINIIKNFIGD